MDQIRVSQNRDGAYYAVDYDRDYTVDSAEKCSEICISDLNCKAWKYSSSSATQCSTSSSDVNDGTEIVFNKGASGGKIEYVTYFSLVQLLVFVIILFLFGLALTNLLKMYYK